MGTAQEARNMNLNLNMDMHMQREMGLSRIRIWKWSKIEGWAKQCFKLRMLLLGVARLHRPRGVSHRAGSDCEACSIGLGTVRMVGLGIRIHQHTTHPGQWLGWVYEHQHTTHIGQWLGRVGYTNTPTHDTLTNGTSAVTVTSYFTDGAASGGS